MEYSFTIDGRLPGLNELINADRRNVHAGNHMKRENQEAVQMYIFRDLRRLHIEEPVLLHYRFYEPNKKETWTTSAALHTRSFRTRWYPQGY